MPLCTTLESTSDSIIFVTVSSLIEHDMTRQDLLLPTIFFKFQREHYIYGASFVVESVIILSVEKPEHMSNILSYGLYVINISNELIWIKKARNFILYLLQCTWQFQDSGTKNKWFESSSSFVYGRFYGGQIYRYNKYWRTESFFSYKAFSKRHTRLVTFWNRYVSTISELLFHFVVVVVVLVKYTFRSNQQLSYSVLVCSISKTWIGCSTILVGLVTVFCLSDRDKGGIIFIQHR